MRLNHYSHSSLGTYEQCPRRFAFRYIEKPELEEGPDSVESVLGTAVHESLEHLYRMRQVEKILPLDGVLSEFEERWQKLGGPDSEVLDSALVADDYRKVGRTCLEKYYVRHHPFNQGQVIGVEEEVRLTFDGGIRVKGYIDRLDRVADGVFEIHDYKTSKRLPLQEDVDEERQLALYQIAVHQRFPDAEKVTLVWHYLRFDAILRSNRTHESLSALKNHIVGLVTEIEAATDFPIRTSNLCDWCEFRELCPAWKHPASVEDLPAREFRKDEGVRLVDRLAKLQEKRREVQKGVASIEEEEESLKREVEAYAAQFGFEQVMGSTRMARISRKDTWIFPKSDDPHREPFLERCRELGLWEQVSGFDRHAFDRLLKNDPRLADKFEGWVSTEPRTDIRLVKRRDEDE